MSSNHYNSTADIDDLFVVKAELEPVIARWKYIGLALRLDPDQLDVIEQDNRKLEDCLTKMLALWLKKSYNTDRFGTPSWELLVNAVDHRSGGNNCALAESIIKRHEGILLGVGEGGSNPPALTFP